MAQNIVNAKKIQSKSKAHKVEDFGGNEYFVTSSTSAKKYFVRILDKAGTKASCNCKWGEHRSRMAPESACSHAASVFNFRAEAEAQRVSLWTNTEDAKRQHKRIQRIGNGVILTYANK